MAKEEYPKKLFIFEKEQLSFDRKRIQHFLKKYLDNEEISFIAYVIQLQKFNKSFSEKQADWPFELKKDDEFVMVYRNRPLVLRTGCIDPNSLEYVISLEPDGNATRITDVKESEDGSPGRLCYTSSKDGSIENILQTIFKRALKKYASTGWDWQTNYPHVSVVTISLPEFVDEIRRVGENIGAEVRIYSYNTKQT